MAEHLVNLASSWARDFEEQLNELNAPVIHQISPARRGSVARQSSIPGEGGDVLDLFASFDSRHPVHNFSLGVEQRDPHGTVNTTSVIAHLKPESPYAEGLFPSLIVSQQRTIRQPQNGSLIIGRAHEFVIEGRKGLLHHTDTCHLSIHPTDQTHVPTRMQLVTATNIRSDQPNVIAPIHLLQLNTGQIGIDQNRVTPERFTAQPDPDTGEFSKVTGSQEGLVRFKPSPDQRFIVGDIRSHNVGHVQVPIPLGTSYNEIVSNFAPWNAASFGLNEGVDPLVKLD